MLTYSLADSGVELFLQHRPGYGPDHGEGQGPRWTSKAGPTSYTVTVTATDPSGEAGTNATSIVTITINNVNEAPAITDRGHDANAHDFNENLKDDDTTDTVNEGLISTFMATDPEDITTADPDRAMTWSVTGPDRSLFDIKAAALTPGSPQTADLTFKKAPDYEMPGDANKDNVYEVTVVVTDSDGMTAMRYVTVKVMNLNEDGEVTLSSQQPKVGVDFTAELMDDDGGVTGLKWKWYRSTDGDEDTPATCASASFPTVTDDPDPDPAIKDDNGDLIRSDTYTPNLTDDAENDAYKCLRAIASYSDGEGEMKSAMGTSANPVVKDTDNKAPKFKTETTTMMVNENVSANTLVGMVKADDKTAGVDDALTYSLGGTNAASFKVHNGNDPDTTDVTEEKGQIRVGSETKLNHETKSSYMVTVTATDPSGLTDSINVTIMVTNVDETPDLMARSKKEQYAEKGTDPVATFAAPDPEGARAIVWSLVPETLPSGSFPFDGNGDGDATDDVDIMEADAADDGHFKISMDGVLSFKSSPNYEVADGQGAADDDNEYKVVVRASDGGETYAYHKVTVMVTNEEEPGTVMLSALQPQVGKALTATHSDPDGGVTGRTWKWERSRSRSSGFINIAGDYGTDATSMYTPIGADVGSYLRATASYTDAEGPNKTAMMVTRYAVEAIPASNDHPAFPDQNAGTAGIQTEQTRTVPEKTPSETNIGAPVKADDGDNDTLTYSLAAVDSSFSIDPATGQLKTKAALDFEGGTTSYTVTVTATDPSGEAGTNATSIVTITVTNVDEAPAITDGSDANAHDFNENLKDDDTTDTVNEGLISTFMATDPEDITTADPDRAMTWSVTGPDRSLFDIKAAALTPGSPQTADLTFKKAPDYEMPGDANKDNVYEVTVVVTDSDGMTAMRYVTVKVMNLNEDGEVTLSSQQPKVGVDFTAELMDDDGGVTGLKWKWYRSTDGDEDTPATCASASFPTVTDDPDPDPAIKDDNGDLIRSDTYTPNLTDDAENDAYKCLRAIASYSDGEGEMKSAMGTSANPVVKDTDNKAPKFKTETTTMMVNENVSANTLVGMVKADDKTAGVDDALTYSLGGTNAASFKVHNGNDPDTTDVTEEKGQIRVGSETKLNHETKSSYMVTVTATDPSGLTDSINVTIMVTNVDETPEIMVGGLAISGLASITYAENGMDPVANYTAAGPDAARVRWSLEGADAGDFRISSAGVLTFSTTPNYEAPADAGTDNVYQVTVEANDGTNTATKAVTITVKNVNEAPVAPAVASQTATKDTAFSYTVPAFTDPEGGTITYTATLSDDSALPGWLSFNASTREMSGTPLEADTPASLTIEVTATDEAGLSDSIDVTITVTDVDEAGTGDPLVDGYDADGSGTIDRAEVGQAVRDFISRQIEEDDVLKVIAQYFTDLRSGS